MGIERFGAGDGKRVDACYEIYRATREADDPDVPVMPRQVFMGWLQSGWIGDPRETWLLEDAGGIGGWYLLEQPSRENGHLAFLDMAVRPERQRHGLGTALLRHAAGRGVRPGVRVAARHDASGELGGLTQVELNAWQPEWGFQALTAVVREHRGGRLGLRLKLAMLDLLVRQGPQVSTS